MTVKIVTRRHSDGNPRQFNHPQCAPAVGSFLENFFSLSTSLVSQRKEELAQDQNIPTAIFEVFRN